MKYAFNPQETVILKRMIASFASAEELVGTNTVKSIVDDTNIFTQPAKPIPTQKHPKVTGDQLRNIMFHNKISTDEVCNNYVLKKGKLINPGTLSRYLNAKGEVNNYPKGVPLNFMVWLTDYIAAKYK